VKHHREQKLQQQNGDEEDKAEDEGEATACRRQHAVRRTTTCTTTLSLPHGAAPSQPPIIVLHEAPVSPQLQLPLNAHQRRRHSHRSSAAPLPEVLLSPGVLETIIVPDYSSRRNNSTTTTSSS